jgi:hypoxanthine phosphoribosyltransferase
MEQSLGKHPEKMSWEQFELELSKLAEMIETKPDAIVAIARGGFIPARLLSTHLSVKDLYGLTIANRTTKELSLQRLL